MISEKKSKQLIVMKQRLTVCNEIQQFKHIGIRYSIIFVPSILVLTQTFQTEMIHAMDHVMEVKPNPYHPNARLSK